MNSHSEIKKIFNPTQVINVNGTEFTPLSHGEREAILAHIEARNREVDYFLARLDEEKSEEIEEVLTKCLAPGIEGFQYWCEYFCYTFNPRDLKNPHKHFILYPYQKEDAEKLLDAIRTGKSVVMDKSRDMGATWLALAVITYCWIFDESFHALLGSRKEDLVDDRTVDSLFGKIDYILERQPWWIIPGYNPDKNRKKLKLEGPGGNLITGESANAAFGRGPRKNVVYLDEYAFWEEDVAVYAGINDTAPCKIYTSTPHGKHNQFAKIRFSTSDIIKVTQHWTKHPEKDWVWYESECAKRLYDPVVIAQELDIDYEASAGGLALPMLQDSDFLKRIIIGAPSPNDKETANARFYGGLDWGSTNPSSYHIYRVQKLKEQPRILLIDSVWEYYAPACLVDPVTGLKDMAKIAYYIKNNPFSHLVSVIFADPSMWSDNQQTDNGVTSLARLFLLEFSIALTPGQRGDTLALQHLKNAWNDPDNILVRIASQCTEQLRELSGLRYQKQTSAMAQKRNQPEKLVDKDNHSWDDFKYVFNSFLDAPISTEPYNQKITSWKKENTGWSALMSQISDLKRQKLENLAKPKQKRRRYFRG